MKASKARRITKLSQFNRPEVHFWLEYIYETIAGEARKGATCLYNPFGVSDDTLNHFGLKVLTDAEVNYVLSELEANGYEITYATGKNGSELIQIRW